MRWMWRLSLVLLLAGYLRWLMPALAPYATGSDASGYLWSARLFRHAALSVPIDVPRGFPADVVGPDVFAPLGARVSPGTWNLVPTYPTGLPLHIAAANLFLSEESAVSTVLIVAAGAAVWLLFLLARDAGLGRWWALAGGVVLAASPLFLFMAVQPMSDIAATAWAEAPSCARGGRRRGAFAIAAGASLGIATLVRPTNALLILPMAVAMPFTMRNYAAFVGGGLPFAAFVAVYQAKTYGHPLASGYTDLASAFSLLNVGPRSRTMRGGFRGWRPGSSCVRRRRSRDGAALLRGGGSSSLSGCSYCSASTRAIRSRLKPGGPCATCFRPFHRSSSHRSSGCARSRRCRTPCPDSQPLLCSAGHGHRCMRGGTSGRRTVCRPPPL